MSRGEIDSKDEDRRNERERSVRASGVPPPSPESEENQVRDIVFGPSEKEDKDGTMALVPAAPGPVNQVRPASKLSSAAANAKGIEGRGGYESGNSRFPHDCLVSLCFSFTSHRKARSGQTRARSVCIIGMFRYRPLLTPRPLVLHSGSGNSTYAANILQGLLAIPQFRAALAEIPSGAALLPRSASRTLLPIIGVQGLTSRCVPTQRAGSTDIRVRVRLCGRR
jgi:hypothetical protein